MTPEQETKVLAQLYDRLYDAVTYAPPGKEAAWHKDTTFIQMGKNLVLNPDDFDDMMSPVNPEGDLGSAAAFAMFCDAQPTTGALWSDSGKTTSAAYRLIVEGANTAHKVNEEQKKIYDDAFDYLNTEVTTEDFRHNKKTVTVPSSPVIDYEAAQAAYITAVGGYRAARNGYDLSDKADQRAWNAVQPGLQLNVDQAWNKWTRAYKEDVELAQQALASTVNDALTAVIEQSQRLVGPQYSLASPDGLNTFLPTYAIPSNWASPDCQPSKLHFDSSNLSQEESKEASSYSVSAGGSYGLWSASGGASGSSEDEHTHMESDSFVLDAELIFVQIKRPWLNPLLFEMRDWFMSGVAAHGVSNGASEDLRGLMPLLPTGFVVARNVTIQANFGSEDMKFHSEQTQTQASGGWGPFSVSGSYSHSSSDRKFTSSLSGGKLSFEGLQVIAWISSIIPASPPLAPPAAA